LTLQSPGPTAAAKAPLSGKKAGKVILSLLSEDDEGGDWVEGEGHLSSLISVRAELARGDLRALYLGWLLRAQGGELDDDDAEPPIPQGLGQLSASLEGLAEFLRIDSDLLHVAAEASSPMSEVGIDHIEMAAWIAKLSTREKDKILTSLVMDADQTQVTELLQRFVKEHSEGHGKPVTGAKQLVRIVAFWHASRRSGPRFWSLGGRAAELSGNDNRLLPRSTAIPAPSPCCALRDLFIAGSMIDLGELSRFRDRRKYHGRRVERALAI
jgi:hypothetical protein